MTEQTELWDEVFLMIHQTAQGYKSTPEAINHPGLPNHRPWHQHMISRLNSHYALTRKEEVPEAVEFGKWLIQNSQDRTGMDRYYGGEEDNPVKTIPELFELYKKQKP